MLGAIYSRRMLCGGHVGHPGSQPASRMSVTEWRHRCARASRAAKRRAGAPGVAPRCPPARSCGSAPRSRRSRWRDRACRRASAQGSRVIGPARGGAAATRTLTHALRQEYSRPAQKMWSLPHGVVRGREFATSSRTRTGGRVVGSRHLNSRRPIGYGHFSLSPRIQLISVRSPPNSRANLLACAGRLDVLGREVSWGRRAWWSRAAVKPAVVPHVRDGSALPLMMTPRGGRDGGGWPQARPFRLDPSDVRGAQDRARSVSRVHSTSPRPGSQASARSHGAPALALMRWPDAGAPASATNTWRCR